MLASLIFVIYFFVILPFTCTNSLPKHSELILKYFLGFYYSPPLNFLTSSRKKNIHLTHNWFRNNCLNIFYKEGILTNFDIHRKTPLHVLWPETSKKRLQHKYFCEFLAIFLKTSLTEHLQMTAPVDFSIATKVLSTDRTLLIFSFYYWYSQLLEFVQRVCKNEDMFNFLQ